MNEFSQHLVAWFRIHGRSLPWRETRDPYLIWLSEVILQQTRVAQGTDYFHRFRERFPDVSSLARASEDEVLTLWQGLGYYSRARNLHSAARWIMSDRDGVFPETYEDLLKLKGVGTYTAAAIASFAFNEDQVVVDGNVLRVMSRYFGVHEDVRLPATVSRIHSLAKDLLPSGQSWDFNQSIMELGALVCLPQKPSCVSCPVAFGCTARKENLQSVLPNKSRPSSRRIRFLNYVLLRYGNLSFFRKRGGQDIWEGLYEPILIESSRSFTEPTDYLKEAGLDIPGNLRFSMIPARKHILSHQELWVSICIVELSQFTDPGLGKWVPDGELEALPKPVIFSKILGLKTGSTLPLTF